VNAIQNVALLDLTGAGSADQLDRVTRIQNVAAILVPESLVGKLMSIPMQNVAATVPIPDGRRVKVMSGQVVLSGEALANPDTEQGDILVVAGQLVITTPVERVGHQQIIVMGQLVAPAGSETGLGAALSRLSGQSLYYPYTPGATVKTTMANQMRGAELANPAGQPTDILVNIGSLVITSPIEKLGYAHVVTIGQLIAPTASESLLIGRVTTLGSGVGYYTAPPRIFDGKDHFTAGFFELLDEPITMVLAGKFSFDDDVSPQLLKQKVREIMFDGKLVAPRRLVPLLQVLAVVRDGKITAIENEDEDEDDE